MDFFSATEVVNRRYSKILKILLGIICFLDGFVIVVEFITAGGIGLIFIVPLIILIPAFLKIGPKKYIADVLCNLSTDNDYIKLVMSNVLIDKNEVLSRSYILDKETLSTFSNNDQRKIYLVGSGKVELLNQKGSTVFEQEFKKETIELSLKKTSFEEMSDLLKEFMKEPNL